MLVRRRVERERRVVVEVSMVRFACVYYVVILTEKGGGF